MPGPHDKIIAETAKIALAPLGFRRKGQSRTWLADHGWWLTIVEFQPSAWSKGSYLNVAAHWLWSELGSVTFDFGGRVAEFVEYQSDTQFEPAVARFAKSAATEAERLTQTFTSLDATARVLLKEERAIGERGRGGWMAYNAGVVASLVGREDDAAEMFGRVHDRPAPPGSVLHPAAERMAALASQPSRLRSEVVSLISRQRDALRLPTLATPPV